jgi:uncharacterized coiled-coil protein SlyX
MTQTDTPTPTRPEVAADRLTGLEERVTRIEATLAEIGQQLRWMGEELDRMRTILLSIGALASEARP